MPKQLINSVASISRALLRGKNVCMDVKANRLKNLRELIDRRAEGNVAKFASDNDLDAVYLRQILTGWNGRKPGDQLARRIEKRVGLPEFWMDEEHGPSGRVRLPEPAAPLPEPLSRLAEVWNSLTPDDIRLVSSMADNFYNKGKKPAGRKTG